MGNGDRTRMHKHQGSTDARLERLEGMVDSLSARVAKLTGDKPAQTFWNSTNGRWMIFAVVIVFLAFMGWRAEDIRAILGS